MKCSQDCNWRGRRGDCKQCIYSCKRNTPGHRDHRCGVHLYSVEKKERPAAWKAKIKKCLKNCSALTEGEGCEEQCCYSTTLPHSHLCKMHANALNLRDASVGIGLNTRIADLPMSKFIEFFGSKKHITIEFPQRERILDRLNRLIEESMSISQHLCQLRESLRIPGSQKKKEPALLNRMRRVMRSTGRKRMKRNKTWPGGLQDGEWI